MNRSIFTLLAQQPELLQALNTFRSKAEATALLTQAAAEKGLDVTQQAIEALLNATFRPRELDAEELLAVTGGMMKPRETWGKACTHSTGGHTCCGTCA